MNEVVARVFFSESVGRFDLCVELLFPHLCVKSLYPLTFALFKARASLPAPAICFGGLCLSLFMLELCFTIRSTFAAFHYRCFVLKHGHHCGRLCCVAECGLVSPRESRISEVSEICVGALLANLGGHLSAVRQFNLQGSPRGHHHLAEIVVEVDGCGEVLVVPDRISFSAFVSSAAVL